jgi:hypothetical protein
MKTLKHGGARKKSGRPPKQDKDLWKQVTCLLRKDTIAKLHAEAGGRFGKYLQDHLDRHPLPSREDYEAWLTRRPVIRTIKKRRVPVIVSEGARKRLKRPPRPQTADELAFEREYLTLAEIDNGE